MKLMKNRKQKPYDPEELRKAGVQQYSNILFRAMRDRERIQEKYRKLRGETQPGAKNSKD